MTESELFALAEEAFGPEPAVALSPVRLPPMKPDVGPYLKVQFVVELVGQQLIPEKAAKQLLESKARNSLGDPEIFVMVPGQQRWRALWQGDDSLTYDSLAFAWDLCTPRGRLSSKSAVELHKRAEMVAKTMARRAVPLRPIEDVDAAAENLHTVRENLDIGVDAVFNSRFDMFQMMDAVKEAYRLGFRLKDSGLLEWRQGGWQEALLAIYPVGAVTEFDPVRWQRLPGFGIGFSVPCNPAPDETLERLFQTLDHFSANFDGLAADDEGMELTEGRRQELRSTLMTALETFNRIGLPPGSPEALRLFEP